MHVQNVWVAVCSAADLNDCLLWQQWKVLYVSYKYVMSPPTSLDLSLHTHTPSWGWLLCNMNGVIVICIITWSLTEWLASLTWDKEKVQVLRKNLLYITEFSRDLPQLTEGQKFFTLLIKLSYNHFCISIIVMSGFCCCQSLLVGFILLCFPLTLYRLCCVREDLGQALKRFKLQHLCLCRDLFCLFYQRICLSLVCVSQFNYFSSPPVFC